MRRRTVTTALTAAVLVLLGGVVTFGDLDLSAATDWPAPSPSTEDVSTAQEAPDGSARELLDSLTVTDPADAPGYDASLFGWRNDTDRNGCDTRNDVLRRDLADAKIKPGTRGCVVTSGTLTSPYSGELVEFVAGDNGGGVDIDHVVAREDAWQSGASEWSDEELVRFGNDPLNLLAVESSLNRSHGSRAADEWVPDAEVGACTFTARQVAVKAAYDLTVTTTEHAAMADTLERCPGGGELPRAVGWPEPEG